MQQQNNTSFPPSPASHVSSAPSGRPLKPHSCVLCQQRKVKCNKQDPCAGCQKFQASCVYRAPPPPRRRKRKSAGDILLSRLKLYEKTLKGLGVDVDNLNDDDPESVNEIRQDPAKQKDKPDVKDELDTKLGRLIVEDGKSQYLENTLWMGVSDELHDSPGLFEDHCEEHEEDEGFSPANQLLLPHSTATKIDLLFLHPEPIQIFRLWQIFLDNVDPITKLCHKPTVQQQILDATADLHNVPRPIEALMFAIYIGAVTSLDEEKCINVLGESKAVLLKRFQLGAEHALIKAGLVKGFDLTVLRAFMLYNLAMRVHLDAQTIWILIGMALRIAQRMGLHRDGSSLNLPVFEAEMRRRLWWQIITLDGFYTELCGAGSSVFDYLWDTKLPLNINDSDLTPNMRENPIEHTGVTEMSFCLLRYEVGRLLSNGKKKQSFDGSWQGMSSDSTSAEQKLKGIDQLEKLLEEKYLRFCDHSIPFHFLVWVVGRCIIITLKLRVHSPVGPSTKKIGLEKPGAKNTHFSNTIDIFKYYHVLRSTPSIQNFYWHVNAHFQWHAFIYLLHELQKRTLGEEVDIAWQQIEYIYAEKPHFITNTRNPLHVAIRNLTLKAWEARSMALSHATGEFGGTLVTPEFISRQKISAHDNDETTPGLDKTEPSVSTDTSSSSYITPMAGNNSFPQPVHEGPTAAFPNYAPGAAPHSSTADGYGFMQDPTTVIQSNAEDFSSYPVDWSQWDDLLREANMQDIATHGDI